MGLNRDRNPDAGWDELRWSAIEKRTEELILNDELKQVLIEDILFAFNYHEAYQKLKELDLIK